MGYEANLDSRPIGNLYLLYSRNTNGFARVVQIVVESGVRSEPRVQTY